MRNNSVGWVCGRAVRDLGLEGEWRDWDLGFAIYVCKLLYIHTMHDPLLSNQQWRNQIASLWPAIKGSLAKVYKPCIRKNCPACQRGDKHPAWILSLSSRGRRKTMYVPQAMVLPLRKAIRNGRRIEYLLYRTGPELLKGYRKTVRKP